MGKLKKLVASLLVGASLTAAVGCDLRTSLKRFAYEGFGRDRWQRPEQVLDSLGIEKGDRVADLGSGSGYFTLRLAEAVGPAGVVYAVDVDSLMNESVLRRAAKKGITNITAIVARVDDPLLPPQGVDLIFTSNTYHHIDNRADYFERAKSYLRPGGRIAILDYNSKGWLLRTLDHSTPKEVILKEMEKAGYRLGQDFEFIPRQSFLTFVLEPDSVNNP